jgi:hypothetical protein
MHGTSTREQQLKKFRSVWEALGNWEINLPPYLDWSKLNSALTTQFYLKLQRSFLEVQYQCLKMKLTWSIAHLDSLTIAKFRPIWDVVHMNEDTIAAGRRVLKVITEVSRSTRSGQFFHWEAVRATLTLSQTLVRYDIGNSENSMESLMESCSEGLAICRSLIPRGLERVENAIEFNLKKYYPPY